MKVIRVLEYDGPREWIKRTMEKSISGTREIPLSKMENLIIREVYRGTMTSEQLQAIEEMLEDAENSTTDTN
jgi:hypothetical protein